jgi:glycyl-tRNA synthetase beta chain
VEEIPASMLEDAATQFSSLLQQALQAERLPSQAGAVWYTPRRIIVSLTGIPLRQDDLEETVTGPPKSVAFDSAGQPTRAAIGFAEKNKSPLSRTRVIQTPKGEYLCITRKIRGEKSLELLRRIIPSSIGKIQFPKTMYWTPDLFRFARPIRWIVALFGGKIVRFRIADVVSSGTTAGHRFLGKSKIAVSSTEGLKEDLRANGVVVDAQERRSIIEAGLTREAQNAGGILLDDPALLNTVVNLNECPSVIGGSFDERFLSLPKEILITVMREHQKYFSVLGNDGRLLPGFLAVVNLKPENTELIRAGHERVLRARLADGAFFWETDRKRPLEDREPLLENVLFQEKLGSYHDKTQRMIRLLPRITAALRQEVLTPATETAAHLCKCDLVTEMVKEFTDLQGIVGGLYAKAEGHPENVWRAVYEHYLPKSTSSPSPSSATGAILGLVDRLDTVCGCFSIGLIPSGSGDPFAVRRQGNGILKIILDHRMDLSLERLIGWGLEPFVGASPRTAEELKGFLEGRLRFLFEEMGHPYDSINAVLAVGFDSPVDAMDRLRALQGMRAQADFLSLASNFKRIANILAQAHSKTEAVNEALLSDPAERALWESFNRVRPEVESARARHDYEAALRSLASVGGAVNEFFEKVLVMAPDQAIRTNRLALLNQLAQLLQSIADLSKMVF